MTAGPAEDERAGQAVAAGKAASDQHQVAAEAQHQTAARRRWSRPQQDPATTPSDGSEATTILVLARRRNLVTVAPIPSLSPTPRDRTSSDWVGGRGRDGSLTQPP
jgi:hypothetical protein